MSRTFKDHFSIQAGAYSRYRPSYPNSLFEYLGTLVSRRELAWDCGTGNGQAAIGLTRYFRQVIASDPSEEQIARAVPHENIRYLIGTAEEPPEAAVGADLVTVAQAFHWFDFERFYIALARVLRPGGVFAAWGYGLMEISPDIDAVVNRYYTDIVGPYWPPDRRHIEAAYQTIPFPLSEIASPRFSLTAEWDLATLVGYLDTWSATQRYIKDNKTHPVDLIRAELVVAWGAAERHRVTWPIFTRFGRYVPE